MSTPSPSGGIPNLSLLKKLFILVFISFGIQGQLNHLFCSLILSYHIQLLSCLNPLSVFMQLCINSRFASHSMYLTLELRLVFLLSLLLHLFDLFILESVQVQILKVLLKHQLFSFFKNHVTRFIFIHCTVVPFLGWLVTKGSTGNLSLLISDSFNGHE